MIEDPVDIVVFLDLLVNKDLAIPEFDSLGKLTTLAGHTQPVINPAFAVFQPSPQPGIIVVAEGYIPEEKA
jgi:hypothetical protein